MEDDDNQQFQNPRSDHSSPLDSWISLPSKSSAPKVDDTMLALIIVDSNRALTKPLDPSQHVVVFNPTYDQLWAPIYGPSHPYAKDGIAQGNNYVGDLDRLKEADGIYVYNIPQHEHKKRKLEKKNGNSEKGEFVADKSTFHGKEERDYQGRSWIAAPKDAKRLVHTWVGTPKVCLQLIFPKHGHLIVLAGMDLKVKIWDVLIGKCMRTYMGHSKVLFDFGYDKNIKSWDTKRAVISAFSTGKIPYVVRLNLDEDKQNILLASMSDKKIAQWDMNTGQITQEYD
ncbi:Pre-mRNA-processing factor 17 [Camellia lanceoleosa]|uniref:Pre-mRNA-processing factor 17 n=1 Tax=Camellia lanceoleosa TaxID=1840588 RepID=A0ACC0I168_9ERIC|nr:Pre-mRNA-processing factor 17 [Camellia lanceoleosa]